MRTILDPIAWRRLALVCCFLGAASGAHAENVFRCGPDGRVFSDRPCGDGAGTSMQVSDTPSADARRQAQTVAQREKRLALTLVKERQSREAEAHAQSLGGIRSGGAGAIDGGLIADGTSVRQPLSARKKDGDAPRTKKTDRSKREGSSNGSKASKTSKKKTRAA